MALQCDLTLAHCDIFYEYIYMRLLLGGGYILFLLTYDPVASIRGRLLFLLTHDLCSVYSMVATI